MTNQKNLLVKFLFVMFLFSGVVPAAVALAVNEDNVGGFAWSENIGWISFNNSVVDGVAGGGGTTTDYGVGINQSTREFSGYAWSENVGWVSFSPADVAGCNGCAGAACIATVSDTPVGGNYPVTGWARVISACKDNLWNGSNCTGGGAGDTAGGWDGCLKLKDSYINSDGDFYGWMTSSADATTGVVGWVNLNSDNCIGSNCNEVASYKVHTSVSFGPVAKMECGGSCPGGYCDTNPASTWKMFAPTGDCSECVFNVVNTSEGDIQCTSWELVGTSYGGTYDDKQNLTFLASVPTGTYTLRLTVSSTPKSSNDEHCTQGLYSSTEHLIQIKEEVNADFMCSLDDPAVIADPLWLDCESNSFKKKIMKGEKIFLSDDVTLGLHSEESADGTQIVPGSRFWTANVDGNEVTGSGTSMSFTAGKDIDLKLEVGDDASRTNCQMMELKGKTLPKWQEVNPVSMIIDNLYANLSKLFGPAALE